MSEILTIDVKEPFEKALRKSLEEERYKKYEPKTLHRLGSAAVIGSMPAITKFTFGRKLPVPLLPATTTMTALGYFMPDILKKIIERKSQGDEGPYLPDIDMLRKQSSLASVGKFTGKAFKFGAKGLKDILKGVTMPVFKKGMPLSERALSIASKGAAGYGAYKGGKYIAKKSQKPDYHTFLRNQILAGNIKPRQLSQHDMSQVLRRGI